MGLTDTVTIVYYVVVSTQVCVSIPRDGLQVCNGERSTTFANPLAIAPFNFRNHTCLLFKFL